MANRNLEDLLNAAFEPAVLEVSEGAQSDPVLRRSSRCDYQVNGALAVAKTLSVSPYDAATRIVELAKLDDLVDQAQIAPNGFINLAVRDDLIARLLTEQTSDTRLGVPLAPVPRTIIVDYSHPNVAKEMHVGHLRTTIIGDALVRILLHLGHNVIKENHIGDWGTPFGMLIEHLLDIGEASAAQLLSIGDLNGFYRSAREKFDTDPEFADRSRRRVVSLQSGDQASRILWQILVDQSAAYFQHVYNQLGVLLQPEDIVGESFYNDMLPEVVNDLWAAGLLSDSQGALCCFPAGFITRSGDPLPVIVRKSDGGYGYPATDLAALRDRVSRLGADEILYVVGAPQREHLAMCIAVAREAEWVPEHVTTKHVAFGSVLGPDRRPFKTRTGASVRLIDLLDEAVEKASTIVREKNPSLPDSEQKSIAMAVGIGAIKYAELSIDRTKDYVFDWSHMLSFEGNTAPYLQYAYARARSVLRKAPHRRTDEIVFSHPTERSLALAILNYPNVITETVGDYMPHKLCTYLYEIGENFAAFYESCPILKEEKIIRDSRLTLTEATTLILKDGLGLLGIRVLERL